MHRFESIELEQYRGRRRYFLVGFVEPKPVRTDDYDPDHQATEYGLTLVRKGGRNGSENEQIVRMDTAHGQPHLDLVYLPAEAPRPRKVWLDDGYSYRKMRRYLLTHWKTFADRARRFEM